MTPTCKVPKIQKKHETSSDDDEDEPLLKNAALLKVTHAVCFRSLCMRLLCGRHENNFAAIQVQFVIVK